MTPPDVRDAADGVVVGVAEQGVRQRRQDASDEASGNNERRRQQRTVATLTSTMEHTYAMPKRGIDNHMT